MKRTDLRIGQELALATSNDWADGSEYGIKKVTVVDTRAFTARRAGYRDANTYAPLALEDGTQIRGDFYALRAGKATCLVRDGQGEVRLVPLTQLRGEWATCLETVRERTRIRRDYQARLEASKSSARERVQAAAAVLKEAGVPVGYVNSWDESLKLGPAALEKIVELLSAQG